MCEFRSAESTGGGSSLAKKMMLVIVAILVLMVGGFVYFHRSSNKTGDSLEKREIIAKRWLDDLKYVVDLADDEEATRVYNYLKEHYVVGIPTGDPGDNDHTSLKVDMKYKDKPDPIVFVPLITEDKSLPGGIREYLFGANSGVFKSGENVMFLKDYASSRLLKGAHALHEAQHAYEYAKHPELFQGQSSDYKLFELPAYRLCQRVMLKIGKDAYRQCLEAEVAMCKTSLDKGGSKVGKGIVLSTSYRKELDKVYGGPPKNMYEWSDRQTDLSVHANFLMVDRFYRGSNPDLVKCKIIIGITQVADHQNRHHQQSGL